jgi:hypothetical protein
MSRLHRFSPGDFEFLEGGFPYSSGVIAEPGFALVRVRLAQNPGMRAGFDRIAAHLKAVGRPLTALCAVELRSPQPFTFEGFHNFNIGYVKVLADWGLVRDGLNPVARSNVCPRFEPPREPVFYAFSYTVPLGNAERAIASDVPALADAGRDYVVAGSGEWPEGQPFPQAIVARGDLTSAGLAAKVKFVVDTMQGRCAGLRGDWRRLTAAQIYTLENYHALLDSHFARAGLMAAGLSWHLCKPPIIELEFEMDVRSVSHERTLW